MATQLDRAEHDVAQHSVALKKPLALRDLALTQILFVVGSSWVGAAAKLGQAQLFFWLLAILLFYVPQAVVVMYLSNRIPLEGGIYQWAKLGFNEFAGFMVAWNLWLLSITVRALGTDRFANHRIDVYFRHELRARVHWQQSHRSYWSRAANIATRPAFLSNRRCHRIDWNFVDDYAHDCFHKRSCNRQLAIANGRRVGPVAPELVLAFASALQNANQLDYLRRDGDARDCYRQPDRCGNPGSVSTCR